MAASTRRKAKDAIETPARTFDSLHWVLIGAISIIFLVLAWPLLTGRVYTYDDLSNSNLPMRYAYWRALHDGDSFLWSPQFYCGVYLHGESEVGMCHPLHLLIYRFLPLGTAYALEFLLSYVSLFFGTFFFLRRLNLERSAALFGGMVFAFGGFCLMHFMHIAPMAVLAHLPWLLLANDVLLCSTDRKQYVRAQMAVLLLTASQLLLGHPQFVYFSVLAQAAFILFKFRQWVNWSRPVVLGAMQVLGLVIGAVQLMPLWDLINYTDRSNSDVGLRLAFSMHPLNLTQLVSPFALKERYYAAFRWGDGNTHEMGLYAGAFCTLVISWFVVRWKKLGAHRWFLLAVLLFGLGALLFSLGKYGGVYRFYSELPGIRSLAFRAPTRYGLLFHLSLAVLAAFAFADLMKVSKDDPKPTARNLWPIFVPVALSVIVLFVVMQVQGQPDSPSNANWSTVADAFKGLLLIGGTTAFLVLALRGVRWALHGIVILTFIEIANWGLYQHIIQRGPPKTIEQIANSIGTLPPNDGGRLYYKFPTSTPILGGYKLMYGNIGLVPAKTVPEDANSLRLANVHWGVVNNQWGKFPNPLPRARLVSQLVISTNVAQFMKDANIETTALVNKPVTVEAGPAGQAEIVKDKPGSLEIKTTAPTRQFLVISESYHHGWQATVDGTLVPVVRAYGDYMGCPVEAGTRTVALHFAPPSFTTGLRVTFAGLGIALCWFVGWFVIKPIASQSSSPEQKPGGEKSST